MNPLARRRRHQPSPPGLLDIVGQVIQFNFQAPTSDWLGVFDRMEVWRSMLGSDGPYTEMTAVQWQPPTIPADLYGVSPPSSPVTGPQVPLVGLELTVLLGETQLITITFTGSNPLTFQQAATQVNEQSGGLLNAFVWTDGRFVLMGTQPGNEAIMHITGADAAPLLGLPVLGANPQLVPTPPFPPVQVPLPNLAALAYGNDARLELISGQSSYAFTDYHGDPRYWYKTRYVQTLNNSVSNFSLPFSANGASIVDASELVLGYLDLVDAQGKPVRNREVLVYSRFGGQVTGNNIGVIPQDVRQLTDANGHVEFELLRGTQVSVAIAGTQLVRDITVPTDPSVQSFSMLDPTVGENDVFVVQVPNVDFVVRRHL